MIYLSSNQEVKFLKGADSYDSVKRIMKIPAEKRKRVLEYAFYLYSDEDHAYAKFSTQEKIKKLHENKLDIEDIKSEYTISIDSFLLDVEECLLNTEQRQLRAYIEKVDKYTRQLNDPTSTFDKDKEASSALDMFMPKIQLLRDTIKMINQGYKANDSRLHLFEIPDDKFIR